MTKISGKFFVTSFCLNICLPNKIICYIEIKNIYTKHTGCFGKLCLISFLCIIISNTTHYRNKISFSYYFELNITQKNLTCCHSTAFFLVLLLATARRLSIVICNVVHYFLDNLEMS